MRILRLANPSSCFYFTEYRDCNDECYFDEDNDDVCDQQEIFGCLDENACNYNEIATESSTCLYPVEVYLDCNNECISDWMEMVFVIKLMLLLVMMN